MAEKSVLIYEQDEKFIKALKLYFRGSDYDPNPVEDAGGLSTAASGRSPDVVLLAIEDDTPESRHVIESASSAAGGAPIVLMSSKKDETEVFADGVASVGATAYIKKPFIKKAILKLLDDVMAGKVTAGPPKKSSRAGVDLGTVFNELDEQVDSFFEKSSPDGGAEFTIALEDDEEPASSEPAPIDIDVNLEAPALAPPHAVSHREEISHDGPVDSGELRRLRERLRETEEELAKKTEEYKQVAREKERIEHSVDKKESELIDRIKTLEKQSEDLEEDVKKRKQHVAQLTGSINQLNEDLDEKDNKHQREIENWQAQLSKLQGEFDTLQDRSTEQAHTIEDKSDEIARLERRIQDLEGERNELQSNLERMTEAKNEGDRVNEGLRGELETERGRMARAREVFESGVQQMKQSLESDVAETREKLEVGLSQLREAADRQAESAQRTLDQAIAALSGNRA